LDSDTWYHWAPTERRERIKKVGLVPGQWSRDRLWKPPYICLSARPSLAWSLSGGMNYKNDHKNWDLWEVWTHEQSGYEELYFDDDTTDVKEIRVYERIFKRNVWYVASRTI
jgi:hypothetical protein